MEEIVNKLLVADNAIIQQGTKELKEAFKNPEAIQALCQLIICSTNPQIRQLSAVLLRKKCGKKATWNKIALDVRNRMKQALLDALIKEQEKFVKNAIAQLIASIGKHEFPNNTWPEVFLLIQTLCSSESIIDKELGMYTLSIMTETAVDQYIVHADSFSFLFSNTLNGLQELHSSLAYYTLITMKHFATVISAQQNMINTYHNLMPRIIDCLKAFALYSGDENRTCQVFELLDDLVDCAIQVIVPNTRPIVEFCLQLALMNKQVPDSVRVKAVSFISWLTRSKATCIQKNKLIEPIIDVLFTLMSSQINENDSGSGDDNEDDEEYFAADSDSSNPMTCATQTLDVLALHIPAEKLMPPLLRHIEPVMLQNDDQPNIPYAKRAAYLVLAVLAEGCSECIRTKYLQPFLQCVCKGITSQNVIIRNAALFALGQFAEHLQPEVSQFSAELVPVLLEYFAQICVQLENGAKEPASIDRMFYALEMFFENLEENILAPYLPTLMDRLFFTLKPERSVHVRELALSAIAAVATAVKTTLLPYFEQIIICLKQYLVIPTSTTEEIGDTTCLQAQAVDTLGILARNIGAENFKPLAQESLQLALNLVTNTDDPDTRKSAYGLFASLAVILHGDIASVLPQVVEQMIESIRSSDGIVSHYKEDELSGIYDNLSDEVDLEEEFESSEEDGNEDDDDVAGYSVENAYIEEKEEACLALKEIAECAGAAFLPFLESTFEEIFKLLNYPQEDIRKAAVMALLQFCLTLSRVNATEGREAVLKALRLFVPKCAELIRRDEERSVVMCALDAYAELLKTIGADVLVGEGHREAIMNCVIEVMAMQTSCQDKDQDTDGPEAEQDELLMECAGDIIPNFGKAIQPDDFALYFPNILKLFHNRMKKQNSVSQRSFAVGTLAECMKPLGIQVGKFTGELLPVLFQASRDQADEVRNNAFFAIGEMVLHGKEHLYPFYDKILEGMSISLSKESHTGTVDNICGALARMILTNASAIPMNEVFPAFVQRLPLREDFQENEAVFQAICYLYQQGHSLLLAHLSTIITVAINVLHKKQTPNEETKVLIVQFLKTVQRDFVNEFQSVVTALPSDVSTSLQTIFQESKM